VTRWRHATPWVALAAASTVVARAGAQQPRDTVRLPSVSCDMPMAIDASGRRSGDLGVTRALGASHWCHRLGVIDSAALGPAMGRTLSEALTARLPGVSVMRSSGVAGTGSRVRLRGPSGILAPRQPPLYIDGIRVESELQSIGINVGGQAPSRLDDVPVEDVECIYVLRGPAATARYGTDAAGGVIHVVTRSARSDTARARFFTETGASVDAGDYPANFGTSPLTPGGAEGSCTRAGAALGQCTHARP